MAVAQPLVRSVAIYLLLLQGCWADFPEARLGATKDATAGDDAAAPDGTAPDRWSPPPPPPTDARPPRDAPPPPPPRDSSPPPDAPPSCTPDAFIRCVDPVTVERCGGDGHSLVTVSCAPDAECDPATGRCDECDPGDPPFCDLQDRLASCTSDGLLQRAPCPLGCATDACCADSDGDQVSDCDGDCDDGDPLTHAGQTEFQTAARPDGSYDYDCDGTNEPETEEQVGCYKVGGDCTGSGWVGLVPECGKPGMWTACVKQGQLCVPQLQPQKLQGCR